MTAEQHAREQRFRIYGLWQTLLGILVVIFMVFTTVVAVWTLQATLDQSYQNGQVLDRLVDCTTPGGECYQQSQSQTGAAIDTINRLTVEAGWCAKSLPQGSTEAQYRQCIEAGMAEQKKGVSRYGAR